MEIVGLALDADSASAAGDDVGLPLDVLGEPAQRRTADVSAAQREVIRLGNGRMVERRRAEGVGIVGRDGQAGQDGLVHSGDRPGPQLRPRCAIQAVESAELIPAADQLNPYGGASVDRLGLGGAIARAVPPLKAHGIIRRDDDVGKQRAFRIDGVVVAEHHAGLGLGVGVGERIDLGDEGPVAGQIVGGEVELVEVLETVRARRFQCRFRRR